jgi:hypothetical protein
MYVIYNTIIIIIIYLFTDSKNYNVPRESFILYVTMDYLKITTHIIIIIFWGILKFYTLFVRQYYLEALFTRNVYNSFITCPSL